MQQFDVIVAGLGAMGSAAFDQLARRGVRVLGIEPHGVPHGQGSSGGDTRLIRKAYFEHPDYVPLLERAYANWRSLETESGRQLLFETGTLYLGQPDSELIGGSQQSALTHGLALQEVSDAELQTDYPQFRRPSDYVALFEPEAGFLLCEAAIRAQVTRGLQHGATLAGGERVVDWQAASGGVTVRTERGRYRAGALVLCAGAWSSRLLAELELPLTVTRQVLFWLQPAPAAPFDLGKVPCWAVQRGDEPGLFYGFPALPGTMAAQLGVKVAQHHPGEAQDPDAVRRPPRREELDHVLTALAPFVPGLQGSLTGERTCLYTMSADQHFIVDRHPAHDNVILACGFSGHGFKFASVMGEALADLALTGTSPLPIGFLGLR